MSNTDIIGVISSELQIIAEISPPLQIDVEIVGSGPKGDKGDIPIKGVDYFTEEDIDEIISRVTSDKEYIHNQITPLSTWNIEHNLNKFPSVSIVDTANNIAIGDIQYTDSNNIILTFSFEFSGKAYLN